MNVKEAIDVLERSCDFHQDETGKCYGCLFESSGWCGDDFHESLLTLLKEQEDLGTELTDAVELIHKKNERIDKLLKQQEAVETKTGHWIESKCLDECFWVCSECNFPSEAIAAPKLYKHCPNCGIKMDEQAVK